MIVNSVDLSVTTTETAQHRRIIKQKELQIKSDTVGENETHNDRSTDPKSGLLAQKEGATKPYHRASSIN